MSRVRSSRWLMITVSPSLAMWSKTMAGILKTMFGLGRKTADPDATVKTADAERERESVGQTQRLAQIGQNESTVGPDRERAQEDSGPWHIGRSQLFSPRTDSAMAIEVNTRLLRCPCLPLASGRTDRRSSRDDESETSVRYHRETLRQSAVPPIRDAFSGSTEVSRRPKSPTRCARISGPPNKLSSSAGN